MDTTIEILKGAERVRRRPAVIFGNDGAEGVANAFDLMLNALSSDCVAGFSKQLIITHAWNAYVSIEEFGRGIYLADGVWKELFCQMYAGSAYAFPQPPCRSIFEAPGPNALPLGDNMDLYAVQCASSNMDVRVRRDGFERTLHFEKGENIGGLTETPCDAPSGTYIRFQPDDTVFTQISLEPAFFTKKAKMLALQNPGLQVICRRDFGGHTAEQAYCFPNGIADYLLHEYNRRDVFTAVLEAEGRERYDRPNYTAKLEVGLSFHKHFSSTLCYHNQRELTYGGTHLDALTDYIYNELKWLLPQDTTKEKMMDHLHLVVLSSGDITCWQNGSRRSIENVLIRDMAQDILKDAFPAYVHKNRQQLRELFK